MHRKCVRKKLPCRNCNYQFEFDEALCGHVKSDHLERKDSLDASKCSETLDGVRIKVCDSNDQ